MYNDMYDTFEDREFEYEYPISFKSNRKDYMEDKYKPYTSFEQGDTVDLEFTVSNPFDIPLEEQVITLSIYNFRYELIDTFSNIVDTSEVDIEEDEIIEPLLEIVDDTIILPIDTTFNEIFRHGTYYVGIKTQYDGKIKTLLDNECTPIYVD